MRPQMPSPVLPLSLSLLLTTLPAQADTVASVRSPVHVLEALRLVLQLVADVILQQVVAAVEKVSMLAKVVALREQQQEEGRVYAELK